MNQDNKTTYNISVSEKESNAVAGFETCPNEKAFTSAPLCDVRSGEGCQRRGEVKPHSQLPIPDSLKNGILFGIGFLFTLGASALLAVAVTGTINTFVNGSVMEASQLNTNFSSLKTAIEGITSSQWTSNGSSIYYNGGNVGIGTVSPTSTLGINVALADTKGVVLQYNGETKAGILVSPTTGEVRVGALNPTGTYFPTIYSNNTERMRIDLSGNVGIGTTTPASKLEVNGRIVSATKQITVGSNSEDVSGVNTIFCATNGGAITLGGLSSGVNGQQILIVNIGGQTLTIKHNFASGTQKFFTSTSADITVPTYGNVTAVSDGVQWFTR